MGTVNRGLPVLTSYDKFRLVYQLRVLIVMFMVPYSYSKSIDN